MARMVSSVMSVGTFDDFFGHEIHTTALLRSNSSVRKQPLTRRPCGLRRHETHPLIPLEPVEGDSGRKRLKQINVVRGRISRGKHERSLLFKFLDQRRARVSR